MRNAKTAPFLDSIAQWSTAAGHVSTFQEFQRLMRKLVSSAVAALQIRARAVRFDAMDSFWLSQTMVRIYSVLVVAILCRRWWLLHGVSLIVVERILLVLVKWTGYTLDDRALRFSLNYIRGWLNRFKRDGERILTGEAAFKFALTSQVIRQAPIGVSFVKHYIRYKAGTLRSSFLDELGQNRFENLRQNGVVLPDFTIPDLPAVDAIRRLSSIRLSSRGSGVEQRPEQPPTETKSQSKSCIQDDLRFVSSVT